MRRSWERNSILIALAALPLVLASCGGGGDGGTQPAVDSTPPLVMSVSPHNGDGGVGLDDEVVVVFSEGMDPATAAGNITLAPGSGLVLTWVTADTLRIAHDAWAQGTEVTLTLGTGLQDATGNPLPMAHTSSFWTWTAQVTLLDSDPASGATGLETNAGVVLRFSQPMDSAALHAAVTIAPPIDNRFTQEIDEHLFRIGGASGWAPGTEYTITVGTGATARYAPHTPLAAPAVVTFTTGTVADTTPPQIVSCLPARGASGVAASTNTVTITFSEAIENESFDPTRVAAHIFLWLAGEPQWSVDRTVLTLFLRAPLPAGVRFFAVFGPDDFRDAVGNGNSAADSVSFTVAGTADYAPLVEGARYEFRRDWVDSATPGKAAGRDTVWVRHEGVQGNGNFDRVSARDAAFTQEDDRMHFQRTDAALKVRGFYDFGQGADVWLSPSLDYLRFPLQVRDWTGTATAGDGSLAVEGHVIAQETLCFEKDDFGSPLILEKCWISVLTHTIAAGGQTVSAGTDTLWWAPGLGVVRTRSSSTEDRDGGPRTYWSRDELLALDPFGE